MSLVPFAMATLIYASVAVLSVLEALVIRASWQMIGFPDGARFAIDRIRQTTYPVFIAVLLAFAGVALLRIRKHPKAENAWRLAALWLLLNGLGFSVDYLCEAMRPPRAEMGTGGAKRSSGDEV